MSKRELRLLVISFGFLHAEPPIEADLVIDLREYRDPHIDPALREMTARDQAVIDTVLRTPGIADQITGLDEAAHRAIGVAAAAVTTWLATRKTAR